MKLSDISKTERTIRMLILGISCLVCIMLVMFGSTYLGIMNSGFTVSLDNQNTAAQVSLYQTRDFENPTATIMCQVPRTMTNTTGTRLPADLDEHDGEHNGANYIAFTFYVKNVGESMVTLSATMNMDADVKGAVNALRVRIYQNGEKTDYAKPATLGGRELDFCDKNFESDKVVCTYENKEFRPNDYIRYTVVIWIEGTDPECLDNIRGGNVKLSMSFSVIGAE